MIEAFFNALEVGVMSTYVVANPELLRSVILLIALALIMLTVGWKLFKGDRLEDPAPAEEDPEDLAKLTAGERYKLWREELAEWTNYDGSTVGLQELLDRWYGIPHEKPPTPWGAGQIPVPPLPVDGRTAAVTAVEWASARKRMEAKLFSDERFRVGQWVRRSENQNYALKGGLHLWKILRLQINFAVVMTDCGELGVAYADLEPALPRVGEWWIWNKVSYAIPFKIAPMHEAGIGRANLDAYAHKGELVPVNFGRGEEARG